MNRQALNRRTFISWAAWTLGALKFLTMNSALAAPKAVKAAPSGGGVKASEESLKGLAMAQGLTDANFWKEGDKIPNNLQNYCDASKPNNKVCGDKRKPTQFCGNCNFIQERVNYNGNVVGKCMLMQPPQPPKTHVPGNFYCGSHVENPAYKYAIKS